MTAYYNENNPKAAARLREYIKNGLIADGVVDDRSITEIEPADLAGFTQVHLFAGIGGWSTALRLANWTDDKPVWTGSCPCQPYSCAGKKAGENDPRDLWPVMYRLVKECRPGTVFGEQVESAIGHGWIDRLQADMEKKDYAVGRCVLGAHSVGSFHRRQRLYWLAHTNDQQRRSQPRCSGNTAPGARAEFRGSRTANGLLADSIGEQCQRAADDAGKTGRTIAATSGAVDRMGNPNSKRHEEYTLLREAQNNSTQTPWAGTIDTTGNPGPMAYAGRQGQSQFSREREEPARPAEASVWHNPDWILCRDNRYRPIEPTLKPLAYGLPRSIRNLPEHLQRLASLASLAGLDGASLRRAKSHRVSSIQGYGNAIVPEVAAEFILAFDGWIAC